MAQDFERKTGKTLNLVDNPEDVPEKFSKVRKIISEKTGKVLGWFDPYTEEVYVYMPNIETVEDMQQTINHEAIAHYGIKNMLESKEPGSWYKLLDEVWEYMQKKEYPNMVFDAATLESIRQTMKANGRDVACGLCFVEDRRQLLGEIGNAFIGKLKGEKNIMINGKKVRTNKKQREAFQKLKDSGDDYIPDLYEIITLEGMRKLRREHPAVAEAFISYNNARGMQAGRLFQAYSVYDREIRNWTPRKVESVNKNGGLRIFSFSDFEAHHLIDIVQVITDCASKGVKIQGYTKVPEFAKALRNTGAKINRSLIPKGVGYVDADYVPKPGEAVSPNVINGKRLLFDCVEGIDINNPDFFDSTDNPNIGNILVITNDVQGRLAMLDPFVDYTIGFHTGLKQEIRDQKGIGDWKNYKYYQLDKVMGDKGKLVNADKHGINIYTEVLDKAEELIGRPVENARDFQEAFFAACEKRGWVPRFYQFIDRGENGEYIYTPGYDKFLVDFKLFMPDGRITPQKPVVPEFDNEFNKQILDKYIEGERVSMPDDEMYEIIKKDLQEKGKLPESAQPSATESTDPSLLSFRSNEEGNKKSLEEERQDLTTTIRSKTSDGTNLTQNIDNAKSSLKTLSDIYRGVRRTRGFLMDLNTALGNNESGTESKYFEITTKDGDDILIRTSNHNINSENIGSDESVISIVVKSRRTPNSFIDSDNNVVEYVYFKEEIKNADTNVLSDIAESIYNLLETGKFEDKSGIAKVNRSRRNKHVVQTNSENFKNWFGDREKDPENSSKVVDEEGKPKVVLHGTPNNEFYTFDENRIGSANDAGWLGRGFYFFGNAPEYAAQYVGENGRVMKVYLNIKNPYHITEEEHNRLVEANDPDLSRQFREQLEEDGYDGIYYNGDLNEEWVAFHPEQIKSATENNGNFDPNNPDIRFLFRPDDKPEPPQSMADMARYAQDLIAKRQRAREEFAQQRRQQRKAYEQVAGTPSRFGNPPQPGILDDNTLTPRQKVEQVKQVIGKIGEVKDQLNARHESTEATVRAVTESVIPMLQNFSQQRINAARENVKQIKEQLEGLQIDPDADPDMVEALTRQLDEANTELQKARLTATDADISFNDARRILQGINRSMSKREIDAEVHLLNDELLICKYNDYASILICKALDLQYFKIAEKKVIVILFFVIINNYFKKKRSNFVIIKI